MDNTDFALVWRKRVTRDFVSYALRELRGDDVRELRRGIARRSHWSGVGPSKLGPYSFTCSPRAEQARPLRFQAYDRHFAGGETNRPGVPIFSIAFATNPDAFSSSLNARM